MEKLMKEVWGIVEVPETELDLVGGVKSGEREEMIFKSCKF